MHANNITLETAREREAELLNLAAPKVSNPSPAASPWMIAWLPRHPIQSPALLTQWKRAFRSRGPLSDPASRAASLR